MAASGSSCLSAFILVRGRRRRRRATVVAVVVMRTTVYPSHVSLLFLVSSTNILSKCCCCCLSSRVESSVTWSYPSLPHSSAPLGSVLFLIPSFLCVCVFIRCLRNSTRRRRRRPFSWSYRAQHIKTRKDLKTANRLIIWPCQSMRPWAIDLIICWIHAE